MLAGERTGGVVDLDALIAEADELVADVDPVLVPVTLGRRKLGVRFVPMSGADWRALTLKHAPRADVPQDLNLGYNVDAVAGAYPHVALLDGETVDDMIREVDGKTVSRWPELHRRLTAVSQRDVARAMWSAHEFDPERLVDEAGKALSGSRKKKRS